MNELLLHFGKVLGYNFQNEELLSIALTHRSLGKSNNERLEYLGDAIVGLFIAERLFIKFPEASESQLTRLRSSLVKGEALAQLARDLGVGNYIKLGAGERKSRGWQKDSILADAMEALIGAIYLDSNLENCRGIVLNLYAPLLDKLTLDSIALDSKTRLQEYLQANKKPLPSYEVVTEEGDAHAKLFTIECRIEGLDEPVTAQGKTKRGAEQAAAKTALEMIGLDAGDD